MFQLIKPKKKTFLRKKVVFVYLTGTKTSIDWRERKKGTPSVSSRQNHGFIEICCENLKTLLLLIRECKSEQFIIKEQKTYVQFGFTNIILF